MLVPLEKAHLPCDMSPMKIVTTHPIATDIVVALGQTALLAAISDACPGFPPLQGLPRGHWTQTDGGGPRTSVEFSDVVSAIAPDLLIARRVGAPTGVDAEAGASEVGGVRIASITLGAASFDALWREIGAVGEALGLGMLASAIVSGLRGRLDDVARSLKAAEGQPRGKVVITAPDLSEVELAWLSTVAACAYCEVIRPEDKAGVGAAEAAILVSGSGSRQALAGAPATVIDLDPALRAPGPRTVELVEMIAAAAWPELVPSLRHRHAYRLRC